MEPSNISRRFIPNPDRSEEMAAWSDSVLSGLRKYALIALYKADGTAWTSFAADNQFPLYIKANPVDDDGTVGAEIIYLRLPELNDAAITTRPKYQIGTTAYAEFTQDLCYYMPFPDTALPTATILGLAKSISGIAVPDKFLPYCLKTNAVDADATWDDADGAWVNFPHKRSLVVDVAPSPWLPYALRVSWRNYILDAHGRWCLENKLQYIDITFTVQTASGHTHGLVIAVAGAGGGDTVPVTTYP